MDSLGRVVGLSAGTTNVIGAMDGATDTVVVTVTAPVLPPHVDAVPTSLATPMANALYDMPVVVIRYFPTLDGVNLDAATAVLSGILASARDRTDTFNRRVKFMLEEGSRFRGYANTSAPPSLGYRIVGMVTA